MLNTFEVKWQSVNKKHPDSEYIRLTRVVTNSAKRAAEYIKENYKADFLNLLGVELIPEKKEECAAGCRCRR